MSDEEGADDQVGQQVAAEAVGSEIIKQEDARWETHVQRLKQNAARKTARRIALPQAI